MTEKEIQRIVLMPCRATLKDYGIDCDSLRPLGCGKFGCAYELPDGNVLKLSHDRTEQQAALLILRQDKLPAALPRLKTLQTLACARPPRAKAAREWGNVWFALIREPLDSLRHALSRRDALTAEIIVDVVGYYLGQWPRQGDGAFSDLRRAITDGRWDTLPYVVLSGRQNPGALTAIGMAYVQQAIELLKWADQHGVVAEDARPANFGIRHGSRELVLRDLGLVYISLTKVVRGGGFTGWRG